MLTSRTPTFRWLALAIVPLASGCFSTGQSAGAGNLESQSTVAGRCIEPDEAERLADQVLQLVNLERAAAKLPPVVVDADLQQVAGDYACLMVEEKFFGHRDPVTGSGPGQRAVDGNYAFFAVGENLAAGQETAADVVTVWMESESHRDIILDPVWKEVGIAVRSGGEYSIYWVIEFGDPADMLRSRRR